MNRYLVKGTLAYHEISRDEAIDLEVNTGCRSTRNDNAMGGVDYVFHNVPAARSCDREFGLGHIHDDMCAIVLTNMNPSIPHGSIF